MNGTFIEKGTCPMDPTPLRRFLLINPNTNVLTTQRLQEVLQPLLTPGVQLDVQTARFGAPYIACEASHAVAAHACLDVWATHRSTSQQPLDGVLIGCFGDPGLFALREACSCPVTGLAEASFIQASAHGPFAIVTGGERWKPMLQRLANSLGYGPQLRHIETVAPTGAALQADPDMAIRCLSQACQKAAQSGVSSIILGGAGLAGYARLLQAHCALPLIDSAQAGWEVLQGQLAPPAPTDRDGFYAPWVGLPPAFNQVPTKANP
jgi:Asp/Glu/hydantoin racemase